MKRCLVSFVISLAACSKSAPVSPDGPPAEVDAPAISADDACTAVSQARCTRLESCSPAIFARRWESTTQCATREKLTCLAALSASSTGATPAHTQGCADAITAAACDVILSPDEPDACLPEAGPNGLGGACEFAGQCHSAYCSLGPTSVCAACAAEPQAGDSCAIAACGPGLACVTSTQLCQAPVQASGACNAGLPCAEGLACVGATASADGTCQAEVATLGTACDPQRKTGPDCSAVAGLTCDTAAKMCVAQPVVAAGQPCGLVGTVRTACAAGATCQITAPATEGTCVAPANDTEACDPSVGIGCIIPAKCVPTTTTGTAGTCQLPGSATCE